MRGRHAFQNHGEATPTHSRRLRQSGVLPPSRVISRGICTMGKISRSRSTHCRRRRVAMQ